MQSLRGILQLDFDGTLSDGDVSTGILSRFAAPEWVGHVDAASRQLVADPDSAALVETMTAGFAALTGLEAEHVRYAREHHPPRPGLSELIVAAEGLGLECHIVSNGFEFYIRDYLRCAGVEGRVQVHTGARTAEGAIVYPGPDGQPLASQFKRTWAQYFLSRHALLVYVGDGASDVAPARLASIVFARDGLLAHMPPGVEQTLRPFETLHDVAAELVVLLG